MYKNLSKEHAKLANLGNFFSLSLLFSCLSVCLYILIFSFNLTSHLSILPEIKVGLPKFLCLSRVFTYLTISIYLARAWETKVGLLEGELKDARDSADLLEFR